MLKILSHNRNIAKAFLFFGALLVSLSSFADTQVTVYTPKGSPVAAYIRSDQITLFEITGWDELIANEFSQAMQLGMPTYDYNCHGWAWEKSDNNSITYWINQSPDLHKFWDDGSFETTSKDFAEKVFYYNGDHSATMHDDSSDYVISKWGNGPLVRHEIGYGPALYNMNYRRYYARPLSVQGSSVIGGTEQKTYTINWKPSQVSSVTWIYPTNLFNVVSSGQNSVTIQPKTSSTIGDGYVTARYHYGNGHTRDVTKYVGVGGPHWQDVTLVIKKASNGSQVYPGGGLAPNTSYYAYLSCGVATLNNVNWGASSNLSVGYSTNSEMYFTTNEEGWGILHITAKISPYNLTKNILDVTLYGGGS